MVSQSADDTEHARVALKQCAAELAINVLGQPNSALSSDCELRFGNRGSLAVVIAGPKAGFWYDHENGQGATSSILSGIGMAARFAKPSITSSSSSELHRGQIPGKQGPRARS
jgi:hypothetical protein